MFNSRTDQKGFTLISALMSMGMVTLSVGAIGALLQNTSRVQQRTLASVGATDLSLNVTQLLAKSQACKASFDGLTFKVDSSGDPKPGTKIGMDDTLKIRLPNGGGVFLEVAQSIAPGTRVERLYLHSFTRIDNQMYHAKLRIETSGNIVTQKEIDVILRASVGSGVAKVFGCLRDSATEEVYELSHPDSSTYACLKKIDIEEHCGDADGCRIKFTMQHENPGRYDEVRTIDTFIYMEQTGTLSNNHYSSTYLWNRQVGGKDYKAHMNHPDNTKRYKIFDPWGWVWMYNYTHKYCPGQGGSHSLRYSNPYHISVMVHPHVKLRMFIYD